MSGFKVCDDVSEQTLPCMIKSELTKNITIGVIDRFYLGTIDPVSELGSSHHSLNSPNSCEGHKARISQGRDLESLYKEVRMSFVGIDVSKLQLDIAVRPDNKRWSVANAAADIAKVIEALNELSPQVIVVEATGGMEMPLVAALSQGCLPVVVVNPRQVRDFAKAIGRMAKTDRIDAEILAHFGEAVKPDVRLLKDEDTQMLTALVTRRRQVIEMLTAEKNRLGISPKVIHKDIQKHIEWLQRRLEEIDRHLDSAIRKSPVWREKDDLLRSVPGVGQVLSASLITGLPELGSLSRRKIAALVGIAPLNCDSGLFRGKRTVWGGRSHIRAVLYMATLSASRFNPTISRFYRRLIEAGKKPKVALTACMRKLIGILNSIVKNRIPWQADYSTCFMPTTR